MKKSERIGFTEKTRRRDLTWVDGVLPVWLGFDPPELDDPWWALLVEQRPGRRVRRDKTRPRSAMTSSKRFENVGS
jgi:hypothetical protein